MQPPVCRDRSPEKVAARMRATLEMHRAGVRMMLAKLQREHPDETREQVRVRLNAWLQSSSTREEMLRASR